MKDRIVGALVGGVLLGAGRRRHATWERLATAAAAALLVSVFAGTTADRLRRAGQKRRIIRVRTKIRIDQPVHEVFEFCKDFENFPRIVGSLRRVVDYQDGRSHWEVATPSGECLEWDAVVTKYVPNSVIAWRSMPRSAVDSTGLLRFAPAPGGTIMEVDVTYVPRDTALADAVLALMDESRQRQLEHELSHLQSLLPLLPAKREAKAEAANAEATA